MSDESSIQVLKERTDRCVQELNKNLDELEALFRTAKKEQGKEASDELGCCHSVLLYVDAISYSLTALRCWRETYGFFCTLPPDLGSEEGIMELMRSIVHTQYVMHSFSLLLSDI